MVHIPSEGVLRAYIDGEWFQARDGRLYILPLADLEAWGPDDGILIVLTNISPYELPRVAHGLGFVRIPWQMHQWDAKQGFHVRIRDGL